MNPFFSLYCLPLRLASNCLSSSFCLLSSFCGTSSLTLMNRSPLPRAPCSRVMPFPSMRKVASGWVPSGMLSGAGPSSVGTSILSPSAACEKVIGSS